MIYSDRIEVTSMGGLPHYVTQKELNATWPLNKKGVLKRVGSRKTGEWKVLAKEQP